MSCNDPVFPVVETFCSIQGESTHAGRVCFFIRLAGCNLRCTYCDTFYAQNQCDGRALALSELIKQARSSGAGLVEITGGEPALNPDTPQLAQALLDQGFEVLMETNGSVALEKFPRQLKCIIDVKLPSSGMAQHNLPAIYEQLKPGDEIKFVTGSRADFDWALEWIDRWGLHRKNVPLIFSCVFGAVTPEELTTWIIESKRAYLRFQLQMHKYIWHPSKRSV